MVSPQHSNPSMIAAALFAAALLSAPTVSNAFDELPPLSLARPIFSTQVTATEVTNTAVSRERRQAPVIGKLQGIFVAECLKNTTSWFTPEMGQISSAKTVQYSSPVDVQGDETYEVDYTEYSGDNCDPKEDTILAKYNLKGVVKFHGTNADSKDPALKDTYRAEWTTTNSTWFFPDTGDAQVKAILKELNSECQCGQKWKAGKWRTIGKDQCMLEDRGPGHRYPYLCYLVNGTTSYGTYKWENPAPAFAPKTYQSSAVQFDPIQGYTSPPTSVPRYKLPEGGVVNKDDCNTLVWFECGNTIQESAEFCKGCRDLECTGCIYRYEEAQINDSKRWSKCCPCMYYYVDIQYGDYTWMEVQC